MKEKRTVELPWNEVCTIISSEIEQTVGAKIECKASVAEHEFWAVEFINQHLPLPKFCQFIQSLQPTCEDWEYALVGEIGLDIKDMSMFIGEKIIGHHLHVTWEYRIIAEDALWLVDVTENDSALPMPDKKCELSDDLAEAIRVIADHLHRQEDSL